MSVSAAYIALNLQIINGTRAVEDTGAVLPSNATPAPIVVEGVVRAVEGATVTLYDVPVILPADAPLLQTVQIGDVVRIEGVGSIDENANVTLMQINVANPAVTPTP